MSSQSTHLASEIKEPHSKWAKLSTLSSYHAWSSMQKSLTLYAKLEARDKREQRWETQPLQQHYCPHQHQDTRVPGNDHLSHWVRNNAKSQVKGHCRALEFTAEVPPRAGCSYLVVRSHVEGHEALEKNLGGLVVAKEGISVDIVAEFGVKQPKQSKESPKQDTLFLRATWVCSFPRLGKRVPCLAAEMGQGRKRREINKAQPLPLPRAAACEAKGQNPSMLRSPPSLSQNKRRRIQLTGFRQGAAGDNPSDVETIQAEQVVEPLLHCVPRGVSDRLLQGNLMQSSRCSQDTHTIRTSSKYLFPQRARQMFYSLSVTWCPDKPGSRI